MIQDLLDKISGQLAEAARKPNILMYKPNPGAQEKFHRSESVGRLLVGSNRSGKTVAGVVEDCWWLTGRHPFMKTPEPPVHGRVITVDFAAGADEIIVPALRQWLPPSELKNSSFEDSYDKKRHKLTLRNGSTLEIKTHDQDLESFAGTARNFLHVDEECPRAIFIESRLRLLDYNGRFWITMTPVEGMTWVYDLTLDEGNNVEVFRIDVQDNPHISDEAKKLLERDLSDEDKAIRVAGDFVPKGGLVLKQFDPKQHVIRPGLPPKNWSRYVSIDSGFNNPTAVLWHAVSPDGAVVTYKEWYRAFWTVKQHATQIKKMCKEDIAEPLMFIGDPSMSQRSIVTGHSIMHEYRDNGIPVVAGKKDVTGGIDKMNEYFRQMKWYLTEECPNAIREFKMYRWKTYQSAKIADKNNPREEPQKKDDHTPDSSRYFFSYMPALTPAPRVAKAQKMSLTESRPGDFPWHVDPGTWFPNQGVTDFGWGEA